MVAAAALNTDELDYQQLLEKVQERKGVLDKLIETRDSWTDEQKDEFEALDKEIAALQEQRAAKRDEYLSGRVEELSQQDSTSGTAVPAQSVRKAMAGEAQRTRIEAVPKEYVGTLKVFRNADEAYDCGLWLQSLAGKADAERQLLDRRPEWRTHVGNTGTTGAITVPDLLSNRVIQFLSEGGVVFRLADVMPMTSDNLTLPKITGGQTVDYPSAPNVQGEAITESQTTWGSIVLGVNKRSVLSKVANELASDSAIAFVERVVERAVYEIRQQLDNEYINGDGTATYGGETGLITSLSSVTGGTKTAAGATWSAVTLANFNETKALLPDKYYGGQLSWLMSRSFFAATAERLVYAQGGNTVDTTQGGTGAQLFGYPIVFSDQMPADATGNVACFFGNFAAGTMLGVRQNIEVAQSADYAFNEDVVTVRVLGRFDINCHEMGSGSTAGAVVQMVLA